jgi:ATP-dependent DNA ligase
MLPTLVDMPPGGDDWIHEIKYDGYQTILAVDSINTRAFTRNGHDWTEKYDIVVHHAAALRCDTAIIDGEIVVQDERGVTDFQGLRRAIRREPERLALFAFDLLMPNGADLRKEPLVDRRRRLEDLLRRDPGSRLQFSADIEGNGSAFFAAIDELGLEGVVSKRPDSRYISGRVKSWLKCKTFVSHDYQVSGVERTSTGIPIALLATAGDDPHYVGNAMITLPRRRRRRFGRGSMRSARHKRG